jgi:hypothetical protein
MKRFAWAASIATFAVLACSNGHEEPSSGSAIATLPEGAPPGPTDAPPNAPPPPAMCGDMNGGGDQHVDFATLMANKVAEKDTAMSRQRELLELRYDLYRAA